MNYEERGKEPSTEKSGDRCPLPEWLSTRLDIPPDIWTGGMRVEIRGQNSAVVHGCQRILEYRPDQVSFQMKTCRLTVKGKRLCCVAYLAGAVELNGRIESVCYVAEEDTSL